MTDFHDIKVGDEVGFIQGFVHALYTTRKVTKVTAKYFDVGSTRFRKDNGREAARGYGGELARPVDAEFLADMKEAESEQERRQLARQLEPKLRTLSLEQLKQIEAIASGGEGE